MTTMETSTLNFLIAVRVRIKARHGCDSKSYRNANNKVLRFEELIAERNHIKSLHGCDSKEYKKANDNVLCEVNKAKTFRQNRQYYEKRSAELTRRRCMAELIQKFSHQSDLNDEGYSDFTIISEDVLLSEGFLESDDFKELWFDREYNSIIEWKYITSKLDICEDCLSFNESSYVSTINVDKFQKALNRKQIKLPSVFNIQEENSDLYRPLVKFLERHKFKVVESDAPGIATIFHPIIVAANELCNEDWKWKPGARRITIMETINNGIHRYYHISVCPPSELKSYDKEGVTWEHCINPAEKIDILSFQDVRKTNSVPKKAIYSWWGKSKHDCIVFIIQHHGIVFVPDGNPYDRQKLEEWNARQDQSTLDRYKSNEFTIYTTTSNDITVVPAAGCTALDTLKGFGICKVPCAWVEAETFQIQFNQNVLVTKKNGTGYSRKVD